MKSQLFLKAGAVAIVLWFVALIVIHFLHGMQSTADSIATWVQKQDWNSLTSAERARRLAETLLDHPALSEASQPEVMMEYMI